MKNCEKAKLCPLSVASLVLSPINIPVFFIVDTLSYDMSISVDTVNTVFIAATLFFSVITLALPLISRHMRTKSGLRGRGFELAGLIIASVINSLFTALSVGYFSESGMEGSLWFFGLLPAIAAIAIYVFMSLSKKTDSE